jgi:hypothetical protein
VAGGRDALWDFTICFCVLHGLKLCLINEEVNILIRRYIFSYISMNVIIVIFTIASKKKITILLDRILLD